MFSKRELLPKPEQSGGCRSWGGLCRFRRDQAGVTAVEFGLVAMPFFTLLFAIIETALGLWSTQVLESAVANASRGLYTGQFQQANRDAADIREEFRKAVCNHVWACSGTTHVDVRPFSVPRPVNANGELDPAAFGYTPTSANEIVIVTVVVEYPVFIGIMDRNQVKSGKRMLTASAAFRNEPF